MAFAKYDQRWLKMVNGAKRNNKYFLCLMVILIQTIEQRNFESAVKSLRNLKSISPIIHFTLLKKLAHQVRNNCVNADKRPQILVNFWRTRWSLHKCGMQKFLFYTSQRVNLFYYNWIYLFVMYIYYLCNSLVSRKTNASESCQKRPQE